MALEGLEGTLNELEGVLDELEGTIAAAESDMDETGREQTGEEETRDTAAGPAKRFAKRGPVSAKPAHQRGKAALRTAKTKVAAARGKVVNVRSVLQSQGSRITVLENRQESGMAGLGTKVALTTTTAIAAAAVNQAVTLRTTSGDVMAKGLVFRSNIPGFFHTMTYGSDSIDFGLAANNPGFVMDGQRSQYYEFPAPVKVGVTSGVQGLFNNDSAAVAGHVSLEGVSSRPSWAVAN